MDALGALACYDDVDDAGGSSSVRVTAPRVQENAPPALRRPCCARGELLRVSCVVAAAD